MSTGTWVPAGTSSSTAQPRTSSCYTAQPRRALGDAAGAISQNVYLFAASEGLATVIRAWIDRRAVADALGLTREQHVVLAQTVGYPPGGR